MRGTLAQELTEQMQDARKAKQDALQSDEPSEADKLAAYQIATHAATDAAAKGLDQVTVAYRDIPTLRHVGTQLVAQGLKVTFNFDDVKLTARWG